LSIKEGFVRDRASSRSHYRFKDDLEAAAQKALRNKFQDFFNMAIEQHEASGSPFSLLALPQPNFSPSSVASMMSQPYPVDSICISTSCALHISYGRAGKTKEMFFCKTC
jgi:hypothetical protein